MSVSPLLLQGISILNCVFKLGGQETIGELHRKACEIFDLNLEHVKTLYILFTCITCSLFLINILLWESFLSVSGVLLCCRCAFGITMAVENMR